MRPPLCLTMIFALASDPATARPREPAKHITNAIGMKFVWIPPGSFAMGSPSNEQDRMDDESRHKVTLTRGFYMGVHTVTQEQFKLLMGYNPSRLQQKGIKNLPVEAVSYEGCLEFIETLRKKEQKSYRLPTEAEWEFSCRAGTTTPFHFGESIGTDQANFDGTLGIATRKAGIYRKKTTPVGSFPANAWGLHDMHGNVWQWCHDWYGDYQQGDQVDPQGPKSGKTRVLRGGSWHSIASNCRSASRGGCAADFRNAHIGFRLCFFLQ
jgi:sulfatase modifying factor 1